MSNSLVQLNTHPPELVNQFFEGKNFTQVVVLVDANTHRLCYPAIQSHLPAHSLIEVPAGEQHKNLETCHLIWQKLTDLHLDRHALLFILGGGVLGDMGGFCAATYKRGIKFVLAPTTLLAQVDASVGGKLGIDFGHFKNHIGVFQLPAATLICPSFLTTLPVRELRSGFAEIIKHCLIADKTMWHIVRSQPLAQQQWKILIPHSIQIKESITQQDPNEAGLRKSLNYGHTLGHALETYFLSTENPIFHGEAVAAGMIMEAHIAKEKGLLEENELAQITDYLISIFGKITASIDHSTIVKLALQDKKNKDNKILMALPQGIGRCIWDVQTSDEEVSRAIGYYQSL
jgi:3-dehydroquinate synthase